MKTYYVYMLTNWTNGVLYTGMTNNLERRINEHRSGEIKGFTKQYNLEKLVYYEDCNDVNAAIDREKQLKNWNREKKEKLVETLNPEWKDLADG